MYVVLYAMEIWESCLRYGGWFLLRLCGTSSKFNVAIYAWEFVSKLYYKLHGYVEQPKIRASGRALANT